MPWCWWWQWNGSVLSVLAVEMWVLVVVTLEGQVVEVPSCSAAKSSGCVLLK